MDIQHILGQNGFYNGAEVQLFQQQTTVREVAKNELLLQPGQVCQSLFFNLDGSFYQYQSTDGAEERIIDLFPANEWFFDQRSFGAQQSSDSYIRAFNGGTVLELTIESLHVLIGSSTAFLQLGSVFGRSSIRLQLFDNRMSPIQKYRFIVEQRRQLLLQFPLKYIASYLKIEPETLSRVRREFVKGGSLS